MLASLRVRVHSICILHIHIAHTGIALFKIDMDLAYTYSLIISGLLVYTLTLKRPEILYTVFTPMLYAPFHERIMKALGVPIESEVYAGRNTYMHNGLQAKRGSCAGLITPLHDTQDTILPQTVVVL